MIALRQKRSRTGPALEKSRKKKGVLTMSMLDGSKKLVNDELKIVNGGVLSEDDRRYLDALIRNWKEARRDFDYARDFICANRFSQEAIEYVRERY